MADADQDCCGKRLAQQLVHRVFQPFVHGRAGFVKKQNLWRIEQRTANGEPLLLTQGQDARPVVFFVE